MIKKKTLVVGASLNADRYAYRAITSLRHNGHSVLAWGLKKGIVADVLVETDLEDLLKRETAIDTVTVYLGARNQEVLGKYWIIKSLADSYSTLELKIRHS